MANSDDFSLDDHFVSSAANKISPAQLEERERQKAIKGLDDRFPASLLTRSSQEGILRFCYPLTDHVIFPRKFFFS